MRPVVIPSLMTVTIPNPNPKVEVIGNRCMYRYVNTVKVQLYAYENLCEFGKFGF